MRKTILILCIAALISPFAHGQKQDTTKLWTLGTKASLSFSQVSLTNWAAGGENSFGGNSFLNLTANLKQGKTTWDNSLDLAYGMVKQGNSSVRKSDDKIDLVSKWGHNIITRNLFLSANFNFKTQFDNGYNYFPNDSSVLISKFMAPGYFMLGLGLDYKPYPFLSISLLPLTGRLVVVNDTTLSVNYGLDAGKKTKPEFGAAFKMTLEKDLTTNVSLKTKLEMFSNYIDRPQNIDINWEALLILKATKYISTYIGFQTIYDHDILIADKDGRKAPRTQFKQTFGVGFNYSIIQKKATVKPQ